MVEKVKAFMSQHQLLDDREMYLVALSGGADSVALLLVLHEMKIKVHAVHCNFHLRGEESDRDEAFCESLCHKLDIPFHRIHFDTQTYAELHHMSIELAARELRYGYFEQLRMDIGAKGVCVAHHRDDSVETILMNLARGTGIHGLTGISPRQGNVLRPLLGVTRAEIEQFLADRQQPFVTDSTNLEDDATRNKVRHHIVPLLKQINPKAAENILLMAERMAGVEQVMERLLKPLRNQTEYTKQEILEDVGNDYLLYELLRDKGFNARQCTQIFNSMIADGTGRAFMSKDYELVIDRDRIVMEKQKPAFRQMTIPEPGVYVMQHNEKLRVGMADKPRDFKVSKASHKITVDADKIRFPLVVRLVQQGDVMIPFGMKGHKLLSDLMTDCKMTLLDKRRQRVVVDASGVVVWLMGKRCDNRVAVDDTTQRILTIEVDLEA
mgnify:FL=1